MLKELHEGTLYVVKNVPKSMTRMQLCDRLKNSSLKWNTRSEGVYTKQPRSDTHTLFATEPPIQNRITIQCRHTYTSTPLDIVLQSEARPQRKSPFASLADFDTEPRDGGIYPSDDERHDEEYSYDDYSNNRNWADASEHQWGPRNDYMDEDVDEHTGRFNDNDDLEEDDALEEDSDLEEDSLEEDDDL